MQPSVTIDSVMSQPPTDKLVADLVARCIVALEQAAPEQSAEEGAEQREAAVAAVLATDPERAAVARQQLDILIDAGLLEVSRAVQEQIGPYRILGTIGQGGMGTV